MVSLSMTRVRSAGSMRSPYPRRLPALEYPGHYVVTRVTNAGTIRFRGRLLFLANALKHHDVGLKETAAACGCSTSAPFW